MVTHPIISCHPPRASRCRGLLPTTPDKASRARLRSAPRQWIFNEYLPERVIRDTKFKLYSDGKFFDVNSDPEEAHPLIPDKGSAAAGSKEKLQKLLDAMPADTPLPFPHRSLSACVSRLAR